MSSSNFIDEPHHLRILFGPLFGVDVTLPSASVLFCVGENYSCNERDGGNENHSLRHAENSLYIPYRAGCPNFRVRISLAENRKIVENIDENSRKTDAHFSGKNSEGTAPPDFLVDILAPNSVEVRPGKYNRVLRFGDIVFAVKPGHDEWSEEVLSCLTGLGQTITDSGIGEPRRAGKFGGAIRLAMVVGAVFLIGAGLTGVAYWQVRQYVSAQRVADVTALLGHAPAPNDVLPGRDGKIHVISASQVGVEWDRQVALKANSREQIEIVSAVDERDRLERLLDMQATDFITVRLDHPERPVLLVTENIARAAREAALASLLQTTPYATQIELQYASVSAIEHEARTALERNGMRYRELNRAHGATFEVAGALGDGDLAALQNLVLSFSRKWGTRRVDFKIAMRTDWLKDRSYREGGEGYVLLDHASWYFPQPLKGTY